MSEIDRVLGRLEEFKDSTKDRLDGIEVKIDASFGAVEEKLSKMAKSIYKIGGALAGVTIALEVFRFFLSVQIPQPVSYKDSAQIIRGAMAGERKHR